MPVNRWKLFTSVIISLLIITLIYLNRTWIAEALDLLDQARPTYLIGAFLLIILSYLVSAQVFAVTLRSLGHKLSILRLWAMALTAITISQSVPAGGVGSYAFLISSFRRSGVSPGSAALIASLEMLSYAMAMLILFAFSLLFLTAHGIVGGRADYLDGGIALAMISGGAFILSRPAIRLKGWINTVQQATAQLLGRTWSTQWTERLIDELDRARALLASRRRDVLLLVLIQLTALCGHSLGMLLVLRAFDVQTNLFIMLAAFGIALITSTFNILPGGGGTVEAALVALLSQLGIGPAAVPAVIIFRLFNFWLLTPVAGLAYHWLIHMQALPSLEEH
jgi:uncharacterized protein (TIRG00374 family)